MAQSDPAITRSVCDVSDRKAVARLFDEALIALGGLDCLVNNAGIAEPTGRVDEIAPEDWDSCVAIDLTGQFNCTRLAVEHLKQSKNASIVNLSSQAGKHGFPLRSPRAAAKWGVIGFTKALSAELGEFGIRANAICPGLVDGPRIQSVIANKARSLNVSHEEMTGRLFAGVSIKQFVDPNDIAKQIVFLALLALRQDDFRPGDLGLRRYADAELRRWRHARPRGEHPRLELRRLQEGRRGWSGQARP